MAISFALVASQNESCYNEYDIKLSTLIANQQQLQEKRNEAERLESFLNAILVEIQDLNTFQQDLNTLLNTVWEEVDEIESLLNNVTTELKELHTTCDDVLAVDCCQV